MTSKMRRVLVCGGRDFTDREFAFSVLDRMHATIPFACVIQGGARGADMLGKEWGDSRAVPVIEFMAEWDRLGRKAGPIRNQRMLDEGRPDLVLAFPGGRGTADMCAKANAAGIRVEFSTPATAPEISTET